MSLPTNFIITGYEVGASQAGYLQYLNGSTWVSLGAWVAMGGSVTINQHKNPIAINYSLFTSGGTYQFRFIDNNGNLISNIITFTFPIFEAPLENIDGSHLENIGGGDIFNI